MLIRARRKQLGISQSSLAEALGLTFQQIQKYERGSNRVSASKLWATAKVLKTPVAAFFEGLDSEEHEAPEVSILHALSQSHVAEIAEALPSVAPGNRRLVRELVLTLAGLPDHIEPEQVAKRRVSSDPTRATFEKLATDGRIGDVITFPFGTFKSVKGADTLARQVGGSGWYEIMPATKGTAVKKVAEPKL